jgi:hypothetical protein
MQQSHKLEYLQTRLEPTLREKFLKRLHSGGIPACPYILDKYENYATELTTVEKSFIEQPTSPFPRMKMVQSENF